jgi:hypothetical protein
MESLIKAGKCEQKQVLGEHVVMLTFSTNGFIGGYDPESLEKFQFVAKKVNETQ